MNAPQILEEAPAALPTLPAAWVAATRLCPWCSGLGSQDGHDCAHCQATGDLLGTMLTEAYKRGRNDALAQLREVQRVAALAVEHTEGQHFEASDLKASMGLPR